MNSADPDFAAAVRSWVRTDESPSTTKAILAGVLAEVGSTPQRRSRWSAPSLQASALPLALGAVVVAVAAVVFSAPPPSSIGGPAPSVSPSSTPPPATVDPDDSSSIPGLPPAGSTPSDATPGELVLRFEPSTTWMTSWLLADGRLITSRHSQPRAGSGDAYIGLVEQRLTASGVEFLTSAVIGSGLFEGDLDLLREGVGFLLLDVRNGDRLAHLRWGHRMWGGLEDAPFANPTQARAMGDLTDLLSSPDQWPASAWADRTETAYVPSTYGICVRGTTAAVDAERVWQMLPGAARDLRGTDPVAPDSSMGGTARNCARLTTDDARALARILDAMVIERQLPRTDGEIWLRYAFSDPDVPGNEIWIAFCPILPHGAAVWLGPG